MAQEKKSRTWKRGHQCDRRRNLQSRGKRVLFDNGSASDVLYYDAMKKLGISDDHLKPFPMPLVGFGNEEVKVQGVVTLPLTLSEEPKTTTTMVDFMVVKAPSAYNVLLGQPS